MADGDESKGSSQKGEQPADAEQVELSESFRKGVEMLPTDGVGGDPSKVGALPPPEAKVVADGEAEPDKGE